MSDDYADPTDAWDYGYEEGCHETMYYCYAWLGLIFAMGTWAQNMSILAFVDAHTVPGEV